MGNEVHESSINKNMLYFDASIIEELEKITEDPREWIEQVLIKHRLRLDGNDAFGS